MEIDIPQEHWQGSDYPYIDMYWTPRLCASIAAEPDPAKRFTAWLREKETGVGENLSTRLIFLEQPYLDWAEAIQRIIDKTERDTRDLAAYEITHPREG